MEAPKETIKYEDFSKLDIRVGTIMSAEAVEKSEKLIKLEINFGALGKRQILTGMKKWYEPEHFVNKQALFIVNLEPRRMMGLESQGMLLSIGTSLEEKPTLIFIEGAQNGEGVS